MKKINQSITYGVKCRRILSAKICCLSFLFVGLAVLSSCNGEDVPSVDDHELIDRSKYAVTLSDIPVVDVHDGCLSFDSIAQMEQVLLGVLKLSNEDRDSWYKELGFVSMQTIFERAQKECSEFTTIEEYQSKRKEYETQFLFDSPESRNLAPQLKTTKPLYTYLLNSDGDVIIGGVRTNFNDIASYERCQYSVQSSTRSTISKANELYIEDGKRKIWVNAYLVGDEVLLRFGQQVNSFWGWNVYREFYHIRLMSWTESCTFGYPYPSVSLLCRFEENWKVFYLNSQTHQWYGTGWIGDGSIVTVGVRHNPIKCKIDTHFEVYGEDMGNYKTQIHVHFL